MSAKRQQYIIGDAWQPTLNIVDEDGTPVDLSSYSVQWALRSERATGDYVVADGMPVTGTASDAGVVTATVTADITEQITAGTYWEEFRLYLADGSVDQREQRQVQVVGWVIEPDPVDDGGGDPAPI